MHYYYIVDSLKQVRENAHLFVEHEACGTETHDVSEDRHGVSEVLVRLKFNDHGEMDEWEKLPFVHPLPHPLEDDELADHHMHKLKRFHPYELKPLNGADVWHHKETGKPLDKKPHTRKMMEQHVGKHFPSFRFRLFM